MSVLMTLFKYSHYSAAEDSNKLISERILMNLHSVEEATIQDVAEFCYVSVATVSRFIKNTGFTSFAQFKQAVVYELNDYNYLTHADVSPSATLDEAMEAYIEQSIVVLHKLRNDLDRDAITEMAEGLHERKKVYIYSFFLQSSMPYLQIDLNLTGRRCVVCEIEAEQYRTIDELDGDSFLLLIKGQQPASRYMDTLAAKAKEQGAKLGVIINNERASILDSADYKITFNGTNTAVDSAAMNDCVTLLSMAYRKLYFNT